MQQIKAFLFYINEPCTALIVQFHPSGYCMDALQNELTLHRQHSPPEMISSQTPLSLYFTAILSSSIPNLVYIVCGDTIIILLISPLYVSFTTLSNWHFSFFFQLKEFRSSYTFQGRKIEAAQEWLVAT